MGLCGNVSEAGSVESRQTCPSFNALFGTRHFVGLQDANDSLDRISTSTPDYGNEPYLPALEPLGETAHDLGIWAACQGTECESSIFVDAFTAWPLAFPHLPDCTLSNDTSLHTFTPNEKIPAEEGNGDDLDIWRCVWPSFPPIHDIDFSTLGLGSQFGINSTVLTDLSSRGDSYASSAWSSYDANDELSGRQILCYWPQCASAGAFNSAEDYKAHIKRHAQEVSSSWREGQTCNWYKCSSKASHKSRNLFEAHLNNIHVNPLLCTVKHCKHKTPFRANHDLQRHIATAHAVVPRYKCPYKSCVDRVRGFIRRDKWIRHLKEHHETEPCPYAHCRYPMEDIPLCKLSASKHIGKAHSNFECALKSCEGKISRFSENQLLEHLELHHAMEWTLVLKARDEVKAGADRVLRSDLLLRDVGVHDCKICGKQ